MIISGVLPIMSLYRLPHGQYAYSGHVIKLPLDVASFANSLPQLPSELDIIVVRKEGAANTHDFRVRRDVVLHALQWLLANNMNRYYLNVRINVDALALLPDDRNLNGLHSIALDSTIDDPEPLSAQNEDAYNAHLSASFFPSTTQWMAEQETIRQSVQERQPHSKKWLPLWYHGRCCWLCCSTTACCHCRELPSDVRRWQICQTPSFSLLCPQHRDVLAGTTGRLDLCPPAPTWFPALFLQLC